MKYPNASIYKLVLNEEVYYGSTTQSINVRFYKHKSNYKAWKAKGGKKCMAFTLFNKDYDNVKMELVELYPCDDKKDLYIRERYYIENNPCVNKLVPARTRQEYIEEHSDKVNESRKKWADKHREEIKVKANSRTDCECGGSYTRANKACHLKSRKHTEYSKEKSLL